jgi:hypothetical protein
VESRIGVGGSIGGEEGDGKVVQGETGVREGIGDERGGS